MAIWATWPALLVSALLILGDLPLGASEGPSVFDGVAFGNVRRQLKSARPVGKLAKRAPNVRFHNELELNYIEGLFIRR